MQYHKLAIVFALAGALAACGGGGGRQQHGPPPLNVAVAQAQRRDLTTSVTLDGAIAPLEQSTLSFQQSGPIRAIYVNVGDRVRAGELLAKIDDSTLRAQLAQAQAVIAQTAAQSRSSQITVPITREQTGADVSSAKAALANAQLTFNQNSQLFRQGYVSQAQLEQSRAQLAAAQSAYRTALANLGNAQVQSANAQAGKASAQSAVAQANTLRTEIGQTSLYAPFDGVVTARLMDPGAFASPSSPVLQVAKVDTVWLNVNVPDEDLSFIKPGTPVTFTTSSLGSRTFSGKISTVNAVPTQGTLSYLARVHQPNPGDLLRGGMLITVTAQQARAANAVVVPRSAIAQTDQGNSVFIVENGKAIQVPVKLGLQTDTLSQVINPRITAGTTVITTRPDALQNGSVVAVSGQNGPPNAPGGKP